ncbi:MAG: PaaI family thioesterase [Parvularculaceae bacterium]
MAEITDYLPVTEKTVQGFYDLAFAPSVKALGLCEFSVAEGKAAARLPHSQDHVMYFGVVCGQAIMAAIDTVTVIAMSTTERMTKGTIYQHTHFLRPAKDEDVVIETEIIRFGKNSAYAETRVTDAKGALVARASSEFAF